MLNSCNHIKPTIVEIILIKKINTFLPTERASLSSADILDWSSKPDLINPFFNLFYLMNLKECKILEIVKLIQI